MATNPLLPDKDQKALNTASSLGAAQNTTQPGTNSLTDNYAAAQLIRAKLKGIYAEEPSAQSELEENKYITRQLSKHQLFIKQLQQSGKPLAEIQTAWHNYYVELSDEQKHEVWQEFYDNSQHAGTFSPQIQSVATTPVEHVTPSSAIVVDHTQLGTTISDDHRNKYIVKKDLLESVQSRQKMNAKQHLKSLVFGLSMGGLVVLIFLFGFFNQLIITPFIQPSRNVGNIPLIINATSIDPNAPAEVIIPKINLEIPVDYGQTSTNEGVIEAALNNGVVHYPNTSLPGQNGNTSYFGHSSNNIFNPGKYKFAFVLLHTLVNGDTFYLTFKGKLYVYQVVDHKIVPPSDVGVLNDTEGHQATATLITCDPPGTSLNRLVVTGVQVSPDLNTNSSTPDSHQNVGQPAAIASNGPSLWSRIWHWL